MSGKRGKTSESSSASVNGATTRKSKKKAPIPPTNTESDPSSGPSDDDEADGPEEEVSENMLGPRQDPRERRDIRKAYSMLREETQANRLDLIKPGNEELEKYLEKADSHFKRVQETREAAMDSQYMAILSNLGKQQAQALPIDLKAFEPAEFAEKLITLIGGQELPDADRERARISKEGWNKLGEAAQPFFKRSPALHCMFGTFEKGPVIHKQRDRRRVQKDGDNVADRGPTGPKQLSSFKETEKHEVTTQEVEHMFSILQSKYLKYGKKPICYFEFVVNPNSFGLTVENMFYASFLVRDGLARVFLDADRLPVIEPIDNQGDDDQTSRLPRHQVVMTMTQHQWQDIVKAFNIRTPLIKRRESPPDDPDDPEAPSTSGHTKKPRR